MASRSMDDDIRNECCLRLASLSDRQHCPKDPLYLGKLLVTDPGIEVGDGRRIELTSLLTLARVDGVTARSWLVLGESGRGKSSLARYLAEAWGKGNRAVKGFVDYKAVLLLDAYEISEDNCWDVIKRHLEDTVTTWGAVEISEWFEDAKVLLIIDDFVFKNISQEIEEALEEWPKASFLTLTTPNEASVTRELFSRCLPTVSVSLVGFDQLDVMARASLYLNDEELEGFDCWCVSNWCIAGEVLSYCKLVELACQAWKLGFITDSVVTTTQFIWALTEVKISESRLGATVLGQWLLVLGKLTRRSLETRRLMHKEELQAEARKLFPDGGADVVESFLPISTSSACLSNLSLPHPLTQFLAAWDVIHQNLHGSPLKSLVKRLEDEDSVVIYAAGHLSRILLHQPNLPEKQVMRAAKNLILHMDRAKNRFGYTLRVINEIRIHPRVVQIMEDEVEFQKIWEVYDKAVLVEPLKALLQHTTPAKIQVSVDRNHLAPDLPGVVSLLAKTAIPLYLAEMNHLQWGSQYTSDNLVNIIQKGSAKLEDFIGCLNASTLKSLSKFETTRNIVCLRVRVKDMASVQAVLSCPYDLTSLMWLEVDFDLPIRDLDKTQVPNQVQTPLMDVSLKDVCDQDVPRLCEFLAHIRNRYSGVHVTQSSLTPQGATDILKQFYRRGMYMTADPQVIKRYRRWRFPSLSAIPPTEELTDKKVHHLLGYDDRHHYSDNEVRSNAVTTRVDAYALANFFVAMEDLVFFRYFCANFSVVKETDGSTEVKELI